PKLKASEDQTPPSLGPAAPPLPCGPTPNAPPPLPPPGQRGGALPRGALRMMLNAGSMTLESSAISIPGIVGMLQQFAGRPVIDKTDLKGLFDVKMQFSREGISLPGLGGPPQGLGPAPGPVGPGGAPATAASDPVPSLFTAIQELGLRLE